MVLLFRKDLEHVLAKSSAYFNFQTAVHFIANIVSVVLLTIALRPLESHENFIDSLKIFFGILGGTFLFETTRYI